jgi:predicted RNA polymerase sigma factor
VSTGDEITVTDGPFAEAKEAVAGFALVEARSKEEALELAQDALVAALEQWPDAGVPDNPGAWLMTTAKCRAVDHIRRSQRLERKQEQLARELNDARSRSRNRATCSG